ncbi:MAG: hypothetical protein ABF315_10900, partial [Lentimonas sp.]
MKRICVIGGSGFVGTRLITLLSDSFEVCNVDKVTSTAHAKLTTHGDVREPDTFQLRQSKE